MYKNVALWNLMFRCWIDKLSYLKLNYQMAFNSAPILTKLWYITYGPIGFHWQWALCIQQQSCLHETPWRLINDGYKIQHWITTHLQCRAREDPSSLQYSYRYWSLDEPNIFCISYVTDAVLKWQQIHCVLWLCICNHMSLSYHIQKYGW